jgi:hypothetical protein
MSMMNTVQKIVLIFALTALVSPAVAAKDKHKKAAKAPAQNDAKELSGISIVGNKEAPKSLFIVPWKSSELGVETGLASSLLNEKMKPVDKEVFTRELDYYAISTGEKP